MPGDAVEPVVEPGEEFARLLVLALEYQHAQRGCQRQRDDARDHHRDRHRDRKLAVELAGQSAKESDRHEHRAQREYDSDHRPADLFHGLDRRLACRQVFFLHDALDVFEHHDRVIDHDTDRQHHAEQRQCVDRVAEREQAGEGADQRHRHGDRRNQRGAPVLQEQEHDQEHQHHGLGEGLDDFADRHLDEARRVVHDLVCQTMREALRQILHDMIDVVGDRERVRAGLQEDADQRCRLAADATDEFVVFRPQFDARNIAETKRRAVRIGAHDDVLEFAHIGKAALGGDRVHQLLVAAVRRLPDLAGGELRVLLGDRARQVAGRQPQLRQAVGLDPDAHRVILGAEDLHVGRAGDALQCVEHVQRDVIRDEQIAAAAIG